ncbi:MAG: hypothetical protein JWN90_517 [Parcubacteria group bacterium]|nr:hypothetical protein [Parcubacteria group bacterium]
MKARLQTLALLAVLQLGVGSSANAKDSKPQTTTIRGELCGTDEAHASMSDRPADAGEDIVVVARRTNHNPSAQTLLVNCTGYTVKSVRVAPDDGRNAHGGREIFDPTYIVRLPGDDASYPILDFKRHDILRNAPTDSLFANLPPVGAKACKFRVVVTVNKQGKRQTLESFLNVCQAYVLVIKDVPPEETIASTN